MSSEDDDAGTSRVGQLAVPLMALKQLGIVPVEQLGKLVRRFPSPASLVAELAWREDAGKHAPRKNVQDMSQEELAALATGFNSARQAAKTVGGRRKDGSCDPNTLKRYFEEKEVPWPANWTRKVPAAPRQARDSIAGGSET